MNVLGLMCSPKKKRNTDTLVSSILDGAASRGASTEVLYINDLNFKPCQDCGYCRKINGCPFKDDMQLVYEKLIWADAVVVGSPTYYGSINAQSRMFIDRCFRFIDMVDNGDGTWTFRSRMEKRKKLIFAGTNGSFGPECVPCQREIIKHLCNDINAEYWGEIFGHYTDEQPVMDNAPLLEEARALGAKLIDG